MFSIKLPPLIDGKSVPHLPDARQLTIIGGSGAGKSKFMEKLMELTGSRTYCLSAVSAPFPQREESDRPGSIDQLFRESAVKRPYMRTDAVSELEKITYMLFTDEFDYLMKIKEENKGKAGSLILKPTKLDRLAKVWEMIFPGNRIIRSNGNLMFFTDSGDDLIPLEKLSQGEKTVLYYVAGALYAMENAVVFIDSPSLFLHPSVLKSLWNSIEGLRPDCTFIYNSVDVEFVSSRTRNVILWVKSFDAKRQEWDYEIFSPGEVTEDIFVDLVGTRKPVLFIEGDISHSIDSKLYPLVFPDYTVKPLGSCDKVIETTRSFNGIKNMHHLESHGLVDRDRRTDREVEYLRKKLIMVPDVAEVENLFLLEDVIRQMAEVRGKNPDQIFNKVKKRAFEEFRRHLESQVLQHVRHRVKREVESKIDARFSCITAMEAHLRKLINLLNPRGHYNELHKEFENCVRKEDYAYLLKVFNHKPLLSECGLYELLGYRNKDEYVLGVISVLKGNTVHSSFIRDAIRKSLRVESGNIHDNTLEDIPKENSEQKINYPVRKPKRRDRLRKNRTHGVI